MANKILITLLALYVTVFSLSCKKTMSTDTPLTVERKKAVIVTTENNTLISFDAYNGTKRWEKNLKGVVYGSPVIYKEKVYAVTDNGIIYAFEVASGKQTMEISTFAGTIHSILIFNDRLYVAGNNLFCYDLNGNYKWFFNTYKPCTTSPTVKNGDIYLCAADTCYRIFPKTDTAWAVWKYAIPTGQNAMSSPVVSGGLVYFGADDKTLYAIKESNASLQWSYTTSDKIISSPMVYGGMCLVGSNDNKLHCVDTTNGIKRWTVNTKDRVVSSPVVHETTNTVLVGSYDFNLYAIDHVNGQVKWKYPAGSFIASSPVLMDNYVYFTAYDKYVYCVNLFNGSTVWKSYTNGITLNSAIVDDLQSGIYSSISGLSNH